MPHAVRINEKSLDLIATNNGGLQPQIEDEATYFLLPDNPNHHAQILGIGEFNQYYTFLGPESLEEFRPVVQMHQHS